MSVFYICGKPGGGKSYTGVKQICMELADPNSNRFIITNIVLKLPELAEWCHRNCQHEVNLAERIRILDDSETGEFWLYEPGRKFEKRREMNLGRRKMDVPDFEDRASRGCLYVIDEVHVFFPAREWQATGQDATFFLSQHRKLQCDVILITQHPEQCDKALRRLAQEYMSVRNLSREPVMGFRLGKLFRYVRTLNSPQSPNPAPFESGFVKLDPEEFGKLYDTTAGVGIAGRVAPRSEVRGRSLWWLLVPAGGVASFGIWFFSNISRIDSRIAHGMQHILYHGASGMAQAVHLSTPSAPLLLPVAHVKPADADAPPPKPEEVVTNSDDSVYCSGFVIWGTNSMVFLSDGRIAYGAYSDIQSIHTEKVKVFGQWYQVYSTSQIERLHPSPLDSSQPSSLEPVPSRYAPSDFDSSLAVLHGDHWQGTKPQVKNNLTVSLPQPSSGSQKPY